MESTANVLKTVVTEDSFGKVVTEHLKDVNGNVIVRRTHVNEPMTFVQVYDSNNRLVRQYIEGGPETIYRYHDNGQLAEVIYPDGGSKVYDRYGMMVAHNRSPNCS